MIEKGTAVSFSTLDLIPFTGTGVVVCVEEDSYPFCFKVEINDPQDDDYDLGHLHFSAEELEVIQQEEDEALFDKIVAMVRDANNE